MSTNPTYWRTEHPKCPHCGNVQQDYSDKIEDWSDGGQSEIACEDCRKPFVVVISTSVEFSSGLSFLRGLRVNN